MISSSLARCTQACLSDSLPHVQQLIAKSGVKALPVVEDGSFRGLITLDKINETYALLSPRRQQTFSSEIRRYSKVYFVDVFLRAG